MAVRMMMRGADQMRIGMLGWVVRMVVLVVRGRLRRRWERPQRCGLAEMLGGGQRMVLRMLRRILGMLLLMLERLLRRVLLLMRLLLLMMLRRHRMWLKWLIVV